MEPEPVLQIETLVKTYTRGFIPQRKQVVKGVSLKVGKSQIVGFLGPNGAGKTTIMKIVMGLVFPTSGSVRIMGRDFKDCKSRSQVGYLPENPAFHEFLSGREQLELSARLAGVPERDIQERCTRLLRETGLESAAGQRTREYSKGMLERLGMANALMHDPEFLILDEPMSGLDPVGRYQMRDFVRKLRGRGKSVFFSTHILADVEMICDRIIILVDGKVRADGVLSELLSEEIRCYEITCKVEREPRLGKGVRKVANEEDILLVEIESEDEVGRFVKELECNQGKLLSLVPKKKSLEEIFMQKVSHEGAGR